MLSPCNSDSDPDQPVADGPVGRYVACSSVGSYGMLFPCDFDSDADQPVTDGPYMLHVGRWDVVPVWLWYYWPCDADGGTATVSSRWWRVYGHAGRVVGLGLVPLWGGRHSPAVACWASDHWVASSNPIRGKCFVINFASLSPASASPSLA